MTIELKRLPGLDGEPNIQGDHLHFWSWQKGWDSEIHGPDADTPEKAAAGWNAMIDRIIEECRK